MSKEARKKFEEYVIENQARFYRIAYSHTQNRDSALDVVQNAVVKGLEHYEDLQNQSYMDTWFYRILLNECYGCMRLHRRELAYEPQELYKEVDKTLEGEQQPETDQELYGMIQKLPVRMRTVIILRYYEDLTLEEISKVIPCSLSAVKYRLYTGLKHLKKSWKEAVK